MIKDLLDNFHRIWLYKLENGVMQSKLFNTVEELKEVIDDGWSDVPPTIETKVEKSIEQKIEDLEKDIQSVDKELKEEPKEEVKAPESALTDVDWHNEYKWLNDFKETIKGDLSKDEIKAKKNELEAICLKEIKLDLNKIYSLERMIKKIEYGEY